MTVEHRRPHRQIYAAGPLVDRFEFLQSLFVGELLSPSRALWISSPWISDIPVIDNGAGRFGGLDPDWTTGEIRLSKVLGSLMRRGTRLTLVTRPDDPSNTSFIASLNRESTSGRLRILGVPTTHDKGIVGEAYSLHGSMNLTHRGMSINEEYVVFDCDPSVAAERRIGLEERWGRAS